LPKNCKQMRRMIAEWEQQDAVLIAMPHEDTDWQPILDEITRTYVEIAKAIATRERLIVVMPPSDSIKTSQSKRVDDFKNTLANRLDGESFSHIAWHECPTNDTWARDFGFISVEDNGRLRLLDFKFNAWGEKFAYQLDNKINRNLYDSGIVKGKYEDNLDFILEGGSIESDGKGTIFTTTPCLLAPHRNQPMTQLDIDRELKRRLGAGRILWINHGSIKGDDTDGHIDTLVRIAPNDTLLYIKASHHSQDDNLRLMEDDVKALRTIEGKPYRLLPLPMPRPIYDDGEQLPATYTNYLVVNGAVLCPTYAQPELDKQAMAVIAEAFPDREIVGIDCRAVIKQHGSLHCCTMQLY